MAKMHPLILYYSKTLESDFPLILVIGREPNTVEDISGDPGPYDFQKKPLCGFWNTSYGMLARVASDQKNSVSTKELKNQCAKTKGSPLIYADSLPHGLPNAEKKKKEKRQLIPKQTIIEHISKIFNHKAIISRTRVVIMSGLKDSCFLTPAREIDRQCSDKSLELIEVPFFNGVNTKSIMNSLSQSNRSTLKEVWLRFQAAAKPF